MPWADRHKGKYALLNVNKSLDIITELDGEHSIKV